MLFILILLVRVGSEKEREMEREGESFCGLGSQVKITPPNGAEGCLNKRGDVWVEV